MTVDSRASVKTFARYDALVSYGIWSRIHHDDEFVEKINQTESVIKHRVLFFKNLLTKLQNTSSMSQRTLFL